MLLCCGVVLRLLNHTPGLYADLQSCLSGCCRLGLPPQEEHNLLWSKVGQHPRMVTAGGGLCQRQAVWLWDIPPVFPWRSSGSGGYAGIPGSWDPPRHRLWWEGTRSYIPHAGLFYLVIFYQNKENVPQLGFWEIFYLRIAKGLPQMWFCAWLR